MNILVIGALPPPYGGTTVSLAYLVDALQNIADISVSILDHNAVGGKSSRVIKLWAFLRRLPLQIRYADVVTLHCCTRTLFVQALPVLLFARLYRKPVVIRKFAGTDYYLNGSWLGRLNNYVLRQSDLVLLETKQLMKLAASRCLTNAQWFPWHRPLRSINRSDERTVCRRFIYVGHVREAKGIRILAQAAGMLTDSTTVDIYGHWFDDLPKDILSTTKNINYMGSLLPEEVVDTMAKYDAFVFPTHHSGEGYPGVILEAYCAGLPVITTRWLSIPEIVDDSVGILVEPRNPQQLAAAMNLLVQDLVLYKRLWSNVTKRAEQFSAETWAEYFVDLCRNLAIAHQSAK